MKIRNRILVFAIMPMLLITAGCGPLLGGFVNNVIKPLRPAPVIEAEHEFGEHKVLIWTDLMQDTAQSGLFVRELVGKISEILTENKAAGEIVSVDEIRSFKLTTPQYARMTIEQLGKKFEADEVLYILIDDYRLDHENQEGWYQPKVSVHTKVLGVESGQRVWPIAAAQRTLNRDEPVVESASPTIANRLNREMADSVAEEIAKFFYKHRGEK